MENNWQERIQNDFPFMKQNHADDERNTYRRFGFQCYGGWEAILRECCESIVAKYAEYGIGADDIDLVPVQIKEKFGTLRFYFGYKDAPCRLAAIDNVGTGTGIRIEPGNEDDDERTRQLRHEIMMIIKTAEEKSRTTCEVCGSPGVLRNKKGGRMETLCGACYKRRKLLFPCKRVMRDVEDNCRAELFKSGVLNLELDTDAP